MTQGLQNTLIEKMAESGCYFLALCELSERLTGKPVDVLLAAEAAMGAGWITSVFKVMNPDAILHFLTGRKFITSITTEKIPGTYSIEMWHNDRTGFDHFRLHDWDSLKDSITVKEGYIKSYRSIKEVI